MVLGPNELGVLSSREDLPLGHADLWSAYGSASSQLVIRGHGPEQPGLCKKHLDTSKDYYTWFTESFARPIIGDVPVSGGRVLGGIICAQVVHMQEETAWALAWERVIWQRDREIRATVMDREWSHFQTELALHQANSMLLARGLRVARLPVPTALQIPS